MHPRLGRKTKVWGEEQKSSFSIMDLMCSRHLIARKAEKGHLVAFSKARATCSPVPAPWRGARALLGDFLFPPPQFSQGECKKGYTKQISSGWTCLLNPGQLRAEKGMQILPAKQKTTPLIAKLGIRDKTKKNKIRLAILNYKLAKRLLPSSRNLSQVQWNALMSWKRCCQDCHQNQQEDRCRRAAPISVSPGTAGLSQAFLAPRFDAPATAKSACA